MGYGYEMLWQGRHVSLVKEAGSSHTHRGSSTYIPQQIRLAQNGDLADRHSYRPMRGMLKIGDCQDLKGATYEEREGRRWTKPLLALAQARAERADAIFEQAIAELKESTDADNATYERGSKLKDTVQVASNRLLTLAREPDPMFRDDQEILAAAHAYAVAWDALESHKERSVTDREEITVARFKRFVEHGCCIDCGTPAEAGYTGGRCGSCWEQHHLAVAGG